MIIYKHYVQSILQSTLFFHFGCFLHHQRYKHYEIVIISNLDYNYIPIDELDYVNYLKYLLGRNDESNIISNGLSSLVSEHRLSLVNSVKRVVLVFTELVNKDDVKLLKSRVIISLRIKKK
jgi:hypothetical protein